MKPAVYLLFLVLLSCNHPWTQDDKQNFLGGCMKGALKDMDEEKARAYCSCMLQKVQKKYPNAADAKYLKNDTAIYSMGRECMK
jgi:uncharacterized membrane protein